MSSIDWKVPPAIAGDDWSTHNEKADWSTHNEKADWSTHNEKTDWKARNEKTDWNHNKNTDWKAPPSFDDDSNKNPFDDANATNTSPPDWKDIPSFHDDSLTKTTPADRTSFHDNSPTKGAPTDNWNTSDNPKVPPSIHDDNSPPIYTPYLQLPHLLSLAWLAYPIISLIFVAFRLQLSLASAQSGLDTAQNDILSSCYAAQQAATGAASLPRYLALASNKQFADAANDAMEAARAALILSLDVLEVTLNFIIDWYRSTFLCVIELVVQGGLSLVIDAVQAVCN